jgi:hypothetical protein
VPCYELNLISVDLKAADHDTLKDALDALGLKYVVRGGEMTIQTPSGRITVKDGKAEFDEDSGCQDWVNKIKQAYSVKTVERIAKRFKFSITTKPGNKMILRRY